jgi:hypothetical protein
MSFPNGASDGQIYVNALGTVYQYSLARTAWIILGGNIFTFPRVTSITSSSTPTPNAATTDLFEVSALATGATFGAPTGTANDGQKMIIRIYDNGSAQTLAWNGIYKAFVSIPLPTTTTIGKYTYVGCIYNLTENAWNVLSVGVEA